MVSVVTGLVIEAPIERVWQVLLDFPSYPRWNPLLPEAGGEPRLGARVAFRARVGTRTPLLRFTGTIRACAPHRLEWTGGVPGLLAGRHVLELTGAGGGTRLVHREDFRGLIALLLGRRLVDFVRPAYAAMDRALARRVAESA